MNIDVDLPALEGFEEFDEMPALVSERAIGGHTIRNRDYIANAQLRLHENRGFSRILDA